MWPMFDHQFGLWVCSDSQSFLQEANARTHQEAIRDQARQARLA